MAGLPPLDCIAQSVPQHNNKRERGRVSAPDYRLEETPMPMQPMPVADLALDLQSSSQEDWRHSWPLCLVRYLLQQMPLISKGGAKHD